MTDWHIIQLLAALEQHFDNQFTVVNRKLDRLAAQLKLVRQSEEMQMSKLDDRIAEISASVAQNTSAIDSAEALINSIPSLLQTAVQDALNNGATEAQLQTLIDLKTKLGEKSAELSAAVVANTPAAPPAPTPEPAPPAPSPEPTPEPPTP